MSVSAPFPFPAARAVACWLWAVCLLIVGMVGVGGITRITESGLSIVNWAPIVGAIPPRNEAEWQEAFAQYQVKAAAQYEKFSAEKEMALADFKEIFFWEYLHRLLGRLIGLAYALPMFWFFLRGGLPLRWKLRLLAGLLLGGAQGVLGWYMVKSGLADKPYVSHFRLAAHLSLALFVFGYLLWMILDLLPFRTHRRENYPEMRPLRRATLGFLALLTLQIVYGAFTAGLRAGYLYNEYPRMGRGFFPPEGISPRFGSWAANWLHNPATVQFAHRHLGLVTLLCALTLWAFAQRERLMARQQLSFNLLLIFITTQFVLGVLTLVTGMNPVLAVSHQVTACFLLGATLLALHSLTAPRRTP